MVYSLNNGLITSGKILSRTLNMIEAEIKPGVSTNQLDRMITKEILKGRAKGAFVGYRGYRYFSCISVNNVIVHGAPSEYRVKPKDVIGVDIGVNYKGWITDGAVTVLVPPVDKKILRAVWAAKSALNAAVEKCRVGNTVGDISKVIEETASQNNLSIAAKLTGHGTGRKIHELPAIPNTVGENFQTPLVKGMVLAVEPMFGINPSLAKQPLEISIHTDADHWGVGLPKGYIGVHFEKTVYVTNDKPLVLTELR